MLNLMEALPSMKQNLEAKKESGDATMLRPVGRERTNANLICKNIIRNWTAFLDISLAFIQLHISSGARNNSEFSSI